MAIATAKKPAKLDQVAKDELLRKVLTWNEGDAEKWAAAAETGLSDEDLRELLNASISEGAVGDHELGWACARKTYGNPIWFGTATPPMRSPDLSGDNTLFAARRVMGVELPRMGSKPGKSTPKVKPSGSNGRHNGQLPEAEASPATAGKLAIVDEIDIPIRNIKPSPENPREDFAADFLDQLGQSIIDHGQLTPLSVRTPDVDGNYEIIDGETRYRAAVRKKIGALRCSVVECTDADAALARVLSYRQRRDLNPLEEARGLDLLLNKYHCSQRELEQKIGVSQGQISNRIRLLKLPEYWKSQVISGGITASQARELAPWVDEPAVLEEMEQRDSDDPFDQRLIEAIHAIGHPLEGWDHQSGANWKIDAKNADLRIRDVPSQWGSGKTKLAFNVDLAESLRSVAIKKHVDREAKKSEKASAAAKDATLMPTQKRQKTEQLKEQQTRKIYRYKIAWLQQRILDRLQDQFYAVPIDFLIKWVLWFCCQSDFAGRREEELESVTGAGLQKLFANSQFGSATSAAPLRQILVLWLSHPFEGWRTDLPPSTVDAFAGQAGIDLKKEWKLDEDFLQLFTRDSLLDLADEWKITAKDLKGGGLESLKRGELITEILRIRPNAKAPERLLKVKEVSLR